MVICISDIDYSSKLLLKPVVYVVKYINSAIYASLTQINPNATNTAKVHIM